MLILVRPHTSLLDGPRIAWTLYRRGYRRCVFPVDPHYARHPLFSVLLKAYGRLCGNAEMRPMDSRSPFAMREILSLLQCSRTVVIFPQGAGIEDANRPDQPGYAWLTRKLPGLEIKELQT